MIHFLIPGDPEIRTGGYIYDRRMASELRRRGQAVTIHRLDERFPRPDTRALDHAEEAFADLPDGALALVDGLAFGALPAIAARHAERLRLAALVHHPLALETGLDESERRTLAESERSALAAAQRVIATSRATARTLAADYGVPAERIAVVEPGVDPRPLASGGEGGARRLLCVGTLTPRKGHELLIAALAELAGRPWTLDIAGSTERDPATADAVRAAIAAAGLSDRVRLHGEVGDEALDALYRRADLFVLASRHEGYGMVLTEALAYGLPIVATAVGAVRETVGPAALLAPPEAATLGDAIRTALNDPAPLRQVALAARERLTGWPEAAARLVAALDR